LSHRRDAPGWHVRPILDGSVIFERPWIEALGEELTRVGAERVFVVAGTSFARKSGVEKHLQAMLGLRMAGFATGIRDHAPREDIIAVAETARRSPANFILAIGGGSVIDAAKILLLCLAADIKDPTQLSSFAASRLPSLPTHWPARMAAVPTTLSGAEFTSFAGATDIQTKRKEAYEDGHMMPQFVLLDPEVTLLTPAQLWLSTGVRALDHAIEGICSLAPNPVADAAAIHALKLLIPSLVRTHQHPTDLQARRDSQIGAWLATMGLRSGVPMGASHAIGHALGGTAGVPHGITSCLMLAHVLRWNRTVNSARQQIISATFGDAQASAGDQVAAWVRLLGLPSRLRDVGIAREELPRIAEIAFLDPWTQSNPHPVDSSRSILALLEAAW
jgi:maleylacetate reductase